MDNKSTTRRKSTGTGSVITRVVGPVVHYDVTGISSHPWREPAAEPDPLPLEAWLRGCVSAAEGSRALRRALWRERGLRAGEDGIEVGWDDRRKVWVLPIRNEDGKLVNVTYRPPRGSGRHPWRIAGRTAENGGLPLYPSPPKGRAWILCAGEWDALAAIQAGLPAVTGLCGCIWHRAWDVYAIGKHIAVVYDVGEEDHAATAVKQLRTVSERYRRRLPDCAYVNVPDTEAWAVNLPDDEEGYDLSDWFLQRNTAADLIELIKVARDAH